RAGGLAVDETRGLPELSDYRMEGIVEMMRGALIAHDDVALRANPLAQQRQNARLADAGFARQHRNLTFAPQRAPPAFDQQCDLVLASDEGGKRLRARGVEPADDRLLAYDKPGLDRRPEALEQLRSERPQLEGSAQQPSRRLRHHDGAGLCQR